MQWPHEDFGDSPSVEELTPTGMCPEMKALHDAAYHVPCEHCGESFYVHDLVTTGYGEYITMDLDPGTRLCEDCLERQRDRYTPDDPRLWDAWTPVRIG